MKGGRDWGLGVIFKVFKRMDFAKEKKSNHQPHSQGRTERSGFGYLWLVAAGMGKEKGTERRGSVKDRTKGEMDSFFGMLEHLLHLGPRRASQLPVVASVTGFSISCLAGSCTDLSARDPRVFPEGIHCCPLLGL